MEKRLIKYDPDDDRVEFTDVIVEMLLGDLIPPEEAEEFRKEKMKKTGTKDPSQE